MESSNQNQAFDMTRRRALHFDSAEGTNGRPLVTRPGRSRGHLHRVDPYDDESRSYCVPNSQKENVNSSALAALIQKSGRSGGQDLDGSRNNAENESGFRSTGSSLNSGSISTLSSVSTSSSSSNSSSRFKFVAPAPRMNKAVTVNRSISWANAINAGHASNSDFNGPTLRSTENLNVLSAPVNTGIGIGIGNMNHHHPLQKDVLPVTAQTSGPANMEALIQQRGLNGAIKYTLRLQSHRITSALSHQKLFGKNFSTFHRVLIFALPFALMVFSGAGNSVANHSAKTIDKLSKSRGFDWAPNRRLQSRKCVLNMFIDKQEPDEFNPDFEVIKPGEKNKDGTLKVPTGPKLEPGTYRTEGQVKVILRFISSVADSFRPILDAQQHIVFTGSRDGGHLADEALKFWPPRGRYQTKLFVVADNEDAPTLVARDHSDRALQYGPIDAIEQRFQNHAKSEQIHIFDTNGRKAGLVNSYVDDDDVAVTIEEEMFHVEDDEFRSDVDTLDDEFVLESIKEDRSKRRTEMGKFVEGSDNEDSSFFSLKKLLHPYLERGSSDDSQMISSMNSNKTRHIIPYLHVDGTSALQQFKILNSAKPLLLDGTVSVVGVENPGDMDVHDIIDYFHSVGYKTFLLGKRQAMRIDHLCDEILAQVMNHPFMTPKRPGFIRSVLEKLRIVPKSRYVEMIHPHPQHDLIYPPFFVAFPRGRASYEEMTIQHMYDLFGGGGGGGQIATANDRKAPTKKKSSS